MIWVTAKKAKSCLLVVTDWPRWRSTDICCLLAAESSLPKRINLTIRYSQEVNMTSCTFKKGKRCLRCIFPSSHNTQCIVNLVQLAEQQRDGSIHQREARQQDDRAAACPAVYASQTWAGEVQKILKEKQMSDISLLCKHQFRGFSNYQTCCQEKETAYDEHKKHFDKTIEIEQCWRALSGTLQGRKTAETLVSNTNWAAVRILTQLFRARSSFTTEFLCDIRKDI